MAKADKVIQALPLSRMVKRVDDVKFEVLSKNGFYAVIGGQILMEFDTLQDANSVVNSLNSAIVSVLDAFRADYEIKIGTILA